MIKEFVKNILFNLKKNNVVFAPVFIIGCGRSGTTILGKTLSQHPEIKYLNERRDLWHQSYPEFNIWKKSINNPQLFANRRNIIPKKNSLIRKLFFREQVLGNAKIVVEKLPINNFRLDFLQASFPEAKFIYLTRNGLEVSSSIERRIQKKNWFTGNKLELLEQFSEQQNTECYLKTYSDFQKGMWEWRLSMEESNRFFKSLNPEKFTHLSYQDFIENTETSLLHIFNFLNLSFSEDFIKSISENIIRKNKHLITSEDKLSQKIGGEILTKTINNNYSPF
jgi:hypothetical protein